MLWLDTNLLSGIVSITKEFSYNLLTVCAVFGGFVYSTLGTMVSFVSSRPIKKLDKAGYMDKYYNGTYITLTLFVLSILIGFVTAFSDEGMKYRVIFLIQLIVTMNALVFFTISVIGFKNLINKVRRDS